MAVYIPIRKVHDDGVSVGYSYSLDGKRPGVLRIQKGTGQITLSSQAEGDDSLHHFYRASHKIKTAWSVGEFPDETCWAS